MRYSVLGFNASLTAPAVPPPAAPNAPSPKKPIKAASASLNWASWAEYSSSRSIRLATPIPSWISSVVAPTVPERSADLEMSAASRPTAELAFEVRFLATLRRCLATRTSPPTPTAACGRATSPARTAVPRSSSSPASKASARLLDAIGTYSAPPAPTIAPPAAVRRYSRKTS